MFFEIGINNNGNWVRSFISETMAQQYYEQDYSLSVIKYEQPDINSDGIIEKITLDIDNTNNTEKITEMVKTLCKDNYISYSSGNGIHIDIPNVWYFNKQDLVDGTVQKTLNEYFKDKKTNEILIDTSMYNKSGRGLIRGYKAFNTKAQSIKDYSQDTPTTVLEEYKDLQWPKIKNTEINNIRQNYDEINNTHKFKCIGSILSKTADNYEGMRHELLIRLTGYFKNELHIPKAKEVAYDIIQQWNNGSLSESELNKGFEYAWNKGYRYGCQDHTLKAFCDIDCSFYKSHAPNSSIQDKITQFIKKKLPNSIELDNIFNTKTRFNIYPGYVISLGGSPGSFKTTIASYISMMLSKKKILFICLDESDTEIALRTLCQAHNTNYWDIIGKIPSSKELFDKINHINFKSNIYLPREINNIVLKEKPDICIIDHIGMVDMGEDYKAMRNRSKFIKNLANESGTAFICIQHVRRGAARDNKLTMNDLKDAELEREGDAIWLSTIKERNNKYNIVRLVCNEKHRNNPSFNIEFKIPTDTFVLKNIQSKHQGAII